MSQPVASLLRQDLTNHRPREAKGCSGVTARGRYRLHLSGVSRRRAPQALGEGRPRNHEARQLQHDRNSSLHLDAAGPAPGIAAHPGGLTATVSSLIADLWHIALDAAQQQSTAQIERAVTDAAEARATAARAAEHADRFAADLAAGKRRICELEQTVAGRDQQINRCAERIRDQELEAARKEGEIASLGHALAQFTAVPADASKSARTATDQQPAA